MSFLRSRRFGFLIGGFVLLLAVGAIIGFYAMRQSDVTSIVLSDGSTMRILQMTYGTNHIYNNNPALDKLPYRLRGLFDLITGHPPRRMQMQTAGPELCIWYDYTPASSDPPLFSCGGFLANERGEIFGDGASFATSVSTINGSPPHGIRFQTWPRRSHALQLHVYHWDQKGKIDRHEVIPIRNRFYEDGPRWQPETLPVTKTVGDLEATLEKFETGYGNGVKTTYSSGKGTVRTYDLRKEGEKSESLCRIHLRQTNAPANIWRVKRVTLSDSTKNAVATGHMIEHDDNGDVKFGLSLWPDETAWKLTCEMKRETGFPAHELVTFNISIPALNESSSALFQTNLNGLTVAITNIVHKPMAKRDKWEPEKVSGFAFTNSLTEGMYVDLVSVKANGKELKRYSSSYSDKWQAYYAEEFPSDAKTLDITMAIQRSRIVEFLVKPVVATTNAMAQKQR